LFVYDVVSGKQIAGPVAHAQFGATAWSADSTLVYFNRLKDPSPGQPDTEKYKYTTLQVWDLKREPVPVAGNGIGSATFTPDDFPMMTIVPDASTAILLSINGVQNEIKAWTAPAATARDSHAPWKLFIDRDDAVTRFDMRGSDVFLLSHKNAPSFQVLEVQAGRPLSSAKVLVPAQRDRVIENLAAASDGVYISVLRGAYSQLLRVATGGTRIEEIALPTRGHIREMFSDPRMPGVAINFSSWALPPQEYSYDPKAGKFIDLNVEIRGSFNPANWVATDRNVKAHDGTVVPLSVMEPKDTPRPHIMLVQAYGSYGISQLADFNTGRAAMLQEGIAVGTCHVRGGGELGDTWRLGGKDTNKHNTWEDLIACGEDLVASGITTKEKLFILGGSAGGITMGRAMTERPKLFAGVIDAVPAANTLRQEFEPGGPSNIPEFGTVTTEEGFKNLYAMDSIQHLKTGVTYPAIMISTGLNDPRVAPWEPAKFAAALLASGTSNPVLLRIDEEAGHGIGSTKTQGDALTADWIAFVKWRAGVPGWRPDFTKQH
jgi:prolyl oligopeptidase